MKSLLGYNIKNCYLVGGNTANFQLVGGLPHPSLGKIVSNNDILPWDRWTTLTLFRMDLFEVAHRLGEGAKRSLLPKICHTYPTVMKLSTVIPYLKNTQKIYESCDTLLELCWHQHFLFRKNQLLLYQKIQIKIAFWYMVSNSFNFFWVFKKKF